MKTIAAVLYEINKHLKIEELSVPELKAGQVLVKMAFSGICHSQLNEMRGLKGIDKFLPHTLGHEGSGIVEAIGPDVKKVSVGDHVVVTWIKGVGADIPSTSYKNSEGAIINSGAIATFLTKTVISENRLVKIKNKMPLKEAALLGCAIPTGAGIVFNTLKLLHGNSIGIFGIGGIGQSALIAAKSKGAYPIIVVDVMVEKLNKAIQLGATHAINAQKEDVLTAIMDITSKKGIDYAIECAGRKESMEIAFRAVRDKGGLCIIAGNLPQGKQISIDPFDLIKGKRIIGTWGGETNPDKDIPVYVESFLSGKMECKKLITHVFELVNINDAFEILETGQAGRILIDLAEK